MSNDRAPVLDVRTVDRVVIGAVTSRDLNHDTSLTFQQLLEAALAAAPGSSLVLDLSAVEFMPSLALGIIVSVNKRLRQDGRKCILAGVQPEVRDVMNVTGLLRIFEVCPTVDDALKQI